jgi:anhydro-N-acetylmuramic acid kinase
MIDSKSYTMIGLMSGTSGDGLDIACCEFSKNHDWDFKITNAATLPFPQELGESLKNSHLMDALSLECLDMEFGKWMGETTGEFCRRNQLRPMAIASHGHTVFHRPDLKMTKQIGNGFALSQASGYPVINDFRKLDVILGGQGAPLVPIGDEMLFKPFDFALNLGGIANISMEKNKQRLAFDTCPFNLLFNHFAMKVGKPYDEGGDLAKSGMVLPELLTTLEALDYYKIQGAKSLGRENISEDFLPLLTHNSYSPKDVLATLSEHFAECITEIILNHSKTEQKSFQLLVTGGGAYNTFFTEKLSNKIAPKVKLILPENQIIDFKEALVFAFLGVLRLREENNCLASVTGAIKDNCGGTIFGLFN